MHTASRFVFGGVVISLLLVSCVHHPDRPASWGELAPVPSERKCPNLSGFYLEVGYTPEECHPWQEACHWLSYNLLSGDVSFSEAFDKSTKPKFPVGTIVELRQYGDEWIDVILWDGMPEAGNAQSGRVISSQRLSLSAGDYSCKEEGLTLSSRIIYAPSILSNIFGWETRTFNRVQDGRLFVRSTETSFGNDVYLPLYVSQTIWIIWYHVPVQPPVVLEDH